MKNKDSNEMSGLLNHTFLKKYFFNWGSLLFCIIVISRLFVTTSVGWIPELFGTYVLIGNSN